MNEEAAVIRAERLIVRWWLLPNAGWSWLCVRDMCFGAAELAMDERMYRVRELLSDASTIATMLHLETVA